MTDLNLFNEFIGNFANWTGALGALFAFFAWLSVLWGQRQEKKEAVRLAEKIELRLEIGEGGEGIVLPVPIRRREVSRAELLGRLGMLPMAEAGKRFSLRHLSTAAFLESLDAIQDGSETVLKIPASQAEIDQFDL